MTSYATLLTKTPVSLVERSSTVVAKSRCIVEDICLPIKTLYKLLKCVFAEDECQEEYDWTQHSSLKHIFSHWPSNVFMVKEVKGTIYKKNMMTILLGARYQVFGPVVLISLIFQDL